MFEACAAIVAVQLTTDPWSGPGCGLHATSRSP